MDRQGRSGGRLDGLSIEEGLELFVTQLEADGRVVHTRKQYARHVCSLVAWARKLGVGQALTAFGHAEVARFLSSPAAQQRPDGNPKLPGSMNALRSSLRGFFRYCHEAGYLAENPSRLVRRARIGPRPPRALSQTELDRLLAVLDAGTGVADRRDRVLFGLMAGTGLRLSSALALNVEDVCLEQGEVRVRRLKGGGTQVVFLGVEIRDRLAQHISDRPSGPLFLGRGGRRIGHRQAQRRFQGWVERTGLRGGVSAHSLRHGFAADLYRRTGDLLVVQAALGHASITSTMVYARASRERIRAAVLAV